MWLKPPVGWDKHLKLRIVTASLDSKPFEVEQGTVAISKGPLETSGLLTCIAVAFSANGIHFLAHVDGVTDSMFLANCLLGAIGMANPGEDFQIELRFGEAYGSLAYDIVDRAMDDAGLASWCWEGPETLGPLDTVRVDSGVTVDRSLGQKVMDFAQ